MRSSKRSAPRDAVAGFTLIEVMIAIVIMAVLSLIAWRGLDSMSRANVQLQERSEDTAQLMRTLQQLQRDLAWRTTIELPASGMEAQARDGAPSTADGRWHACLLLIGASFNSDASTFIDPMSFSQTSSLTSVSPGKSRTMSAGSGEPVTYTSPSGLG